MILLELQTKKQAMKLKKLSNWCAKLQACYHCTPLWSFLKSVRQIFPSITFYCLTDILWCFPWRKSHCLTSLSYRILTDHNPNSLGSPTLWGEFGWLWKEGWRLKEGTFCPSWVVPLLHLLSVAHPRVRLGLMVFTASRFHSDSNRQQASLSLRPADIVPENLVKSLTPGNCLRLLQSAKWLCCIMLPRTNKCCIPK